VQFRHFFAVAFLHDAGSCDADSELLERQSRRTGHISYYANQEIAVGGQKLPSTRALRRIQWRLLPFLGLLYIVSFLDRVNISFAKLTMNADLGFDDSVYALGAGIFFLGYFLFEVPSNLILARVGARRWIARIMITWGLLSAGTAFVTGPTGFIWLRFALGVAEAGFFPGILLYLTYWFPAAERARVVGLFVAAIPVSGLIGSPISSELLGLEGWLGLHGWQWLLLVEGLPAILLGFVCLVLLPDGPQDVKWLMPEEREWLTTTLASERAALERLGHHSLRAALTHPLVWVLALVYFGIIFGLYGFGFWLPTLIRGFGVELTRIGWIATLPFACGAVFTVWWSRHSDFKQERIWHFIVPALMGFLGFAAASQASSNFVQLLCLCVAAMGIYAAMPVFWTLPSMYLAGTAAAAGIALINSFGNLAGYVGPQVITWLTGDSGDFGPALLSLGIAMLVSAAIVATTRARLITSARKS
jgi:ACS family tartrate transporter-like MFS transporter